MSPTVIAFYATVATFIPVLYIALVIQGRASEGIFAVVRSFIRRLFRTNTEETLTRTILTVSAVFALIAGTLAIIFIGTYTEVLAVYALYQGQDEPLTRSTVLQFTIILIIAVGASALVTFIRAAINAGRQLIKDLTKDLNDSEQAQRLDGEQAQQEDEKIPPAAP
jgi:MFS family permease